MSGDAAKLRLVTHTAKRHSLEFASQRTGDRTAKARLADAGGPTNNRIGLLLVGLSLTTASDSRMRSFYVLEAVVVLVKHLAGLV